MIWLILYLGLGLIVIALSVAKEVYRFGIGLPSLEGFVMLAGALALWPIILVASFIEWIRDES